MDTSPPVDTMEDEAPESVDVSSKLPPVPNYPAPLPPSLKEAPVWDGPEPESDSEDDESVTESADYEEVTHEPLTEEQAQETLNEVKQVVGKDGRRVYAYEQQLPPEPAPLVPPDEDYGGGYDPFRSAHVETASAAPAPVIDLTSVDLSSEKKQESLQLLQAYFRACLVRGWYAKRLTMIFHRNKVAAEILSTEQTYVHNLKILTGIFMPPLQVGMNSSQPIISQAAYEKLFPRLEIIQALNKELVEAVRERVDAWNDHTCLADVFLKMGAFFKMYAEYCSKYEEAIRVYRELVKKSAPFREYLKQLEGLPDLQSLDLPSFLILPCQRIPRYLMLISELNKWTWADHPDKQNLEKAVEMWQEVANHVNESMDEAARMNELLSIERKFNNELNLVVPYRKFIKQGPIHKITSRIVVTPTYFLFNDILVYGYPSGDDESVHYKGTIQLGPSWVRNLADTPELQHAFQLVTPDKAYTLYLDTSKEKRDWMSAIEGSINRLVAIDPMLVTRRATQVKRRTRVGQHFWNLFTKDIDGFNASEDAIIKESVSSVNQSLAQAHQAPRSFVPVRNSLELGWTSVSGRKSTSMSPTEQEPKRHPNHQQPHNATQTSRPTSEHQGAPHPAAAKESPHKSLQTDKSAPNSSVKSSQKTHQGGQISSPLTPMEPEVLPSFDNLGLQSKPIRQGIQRDEDPLNAEHVSLDEAIEHRSPKSTRSSSPSSPSMNDKTRSTRSKLIGRDKNYSALPDERPLYGSLHPDSADPENSGCCSTCTIL